jgi:glycine/sarcosine N-methyltransferase
MPRPMDDFYTDLALDYHWLFSDDTVGGSPIFGATSPGNAALLAEAISTLAPGAPILDCSCGIGADAIALSNLGFTVTATDASASMIAATRSRAAKYATGIDVIQSRWEELPGTAVGPFDLVICLGNALVHSETAPQMVRALQAMRRVLRPGGRLVVDSRNWELLYNSKTRVIPAPTVIERGGQRCSSLYVWSIPDAFGEPCRAEIILLFEGAERKVTHRRYVVDFQPFAHGSLLDAMQSAGFSVTQDSFRPDGSFYAVVGEVV